MQDELLKSYMQVLTEGSESSEVKGATPKTGKDAFGDFKEGNEADENVEVTKPEESQHSFDLKKSEPKKVGGVKESKFSNPFDELYNKILGENSFNFSTEDENELEPSEDFGTSDDLMDMGSEDLNDELSDDEESLEDEMDEEEGEEVDLVAVLSKLKDVLSELEKIVGEEENDEEEEIEDIEDLEDEGDLDHELEETPEEEAEEEEVKEEGFKRKSDDDKKRKEKFGKNKFQKKSSNPKNKLKSSSYDDQDDDQEDLKESVKVKGLKKGVNLKPFKGNIKPLQSKKAEVTGNKLKAAKGKAQTPSTGKGFDGVASKFSPTAGHNLMKASSHTVSGAVKPNKGLFEQ